jgi:enolase
MVPSGASTGIHEALELRDGGKRYLGLGVQKAIRNINRIIAPKIIGLDCHDQIGIDKVMCRLDGTAGKRKLGANAILGVSLATARVAALTEDRPMYEYLAHLTGNKRPIIPAPFMNVINGGRHAGTNIDFQEFMIVPFGKTFAESLRMASETYHTLKGIIEKDYGRVSTNVGDEGGFTPHCHGEGRKVCELVEEPLALLQKAVEKLGYGKRIKFAIDAAASEFYEKGKYRIRGRLISGEHLADAYEDLVGMYDIVSIEDPFAQDRFDQFASFTRRVRRRIQVVGDDLTVTNVQRIRRAAKVRACTCLLLKVNQVGTLSEAIAAARLARSSGWNVMVSHRSGETEDHFIADFAVGLGNQQLKAGAPCRGERTSKYNQLLRIEEKLGRSSQFCSKTCWLPRA